MRYPQKQRIKQPYKGFQPSPCHWTRKGKGRWRQKVVYDTEDDAEEFLQQNPHLIRKGYKAYKCPICNKWHVGHENNHQ